jgi:hypothetical protein
MPKYKLAKQIILFAIAIVCCLLIYDNFIREKKYYLSYKYKDIANTDPVCKVYVDALNTYPLVEDFFEAPMQPLSSELTYPKWEQLEIYDNKDLFTRTHNRYISAEELEESSDDLKRGDVYYQYDENDKWSKRTAQDKRDALTKRWQMYYTTLDADNDGKVDDIVRMDVDRYHTKKYSFKYHTLIYIFDATEQKSFKKRELNRLYLDTIYSFFFYEGETYVKDITYDLRKYGFLSMLIKKFNDKKELVTLCLIDRE